jgi:cyclase
MLKQRIIPCLLLDGVDLVKTQKFKTPKYVGDPINTIRIFNEKEVDELLVLDINASKMKCEPNYELIKEIAGECFMPLCYGGGIKSVQQAKRLFSIGVEKIVIQSAALNNLEIIKEITCLYGSQSLVVSIDVKKNIFGQYKLYDAANSRIISQSWLDFLVGAVTAGAGEILVNCVDRDGVLKGMDLEIIKEAACSCSVPLIALGGAGSLLDIKAAIDSGASAVAAGAFFIYHGPHRAVLITYPNYSELVKLFE